MVDHCCHTRRGKGEGAKQGERERGAPHHFTVKRTFTSRELSIPDWSTARIVAR